VNSTFPKGFSTLGVKAHEVSETMGTKVKVIIMFQVGPSIYH